LGEQFQNPIEIPGIIETDKCDTLRTHRHDRSLFCLGTSTSIQWHG